MAGQGALAMTREEEMELDSSVSSHLAGKIGCFLERKKSLWTGQW